MRGTRRIGTLALGTVLALSGLAGCGDDSGGDTSTGTDDTSEETTTTTGADDATTTVPAEDESEPEISAENCPELALAASGVADPAQGDEIDFGELSSDLSALAGEVEDDIVDDLEVLSDAYAEADDAVGGEPVDMSDPANVTAGSELGPIFSSPGFIEATQNLSAYIEAECGTG